jgi:hypothetical protein
MRLFRITPPLGGLKQFRFRKIKPCASIVHGKEVTFLEGRHRNRTQSRAYLDDRAVGHDLFNLLDLLVGNGNTPFRPVKLDVLFTNP